MKKELLAIKDFLDESYLKYNTNLFIDSDPISIPRKFSKKEDIEIAGFLSATIAWGNRKSIIKNAYRLVKLLENNPFDFLMNATNQEIDNLSEFKHRTFQHIDLTFFLYALQNIYKKHGGLEQVFSTGFQQEQSIKSAISYFRKIFFEIPYPTRTLKHISDVDKNSAAKRINLFLMWMIRNNSTGVHFGLWKDIPAAALMLPLDVHSGNTSRKLGLLLRKPNDWKAVEEVTANLRKFDPDDPVKYDFSLFGMGVFEKF